MALWLESWTCNPKVAGSIPRSGRNCRWGEWITSALSTFNTTTEVRPLSKAPIPQLLPGRRNMAAHCSGCVFTAVCVHLDGLNAENKFRVWVTILGHTHHFPLYQKLTYSLKNKATFYSQFVKLTTENVCSTNELLVKAFKDCSTFSNARSFKPLFYICVLFSKLLAL